MVSGVYLSVVGWSWHGSALRVVDTPSDWFFQILALGFESLACVARS